MMAGVDILIPTYARSTALAVTLTSLAGQSHRDFRVIISDQSDMPLPSASGELRAAMRVLELHGNRVEYLRHVPRRGMAEQRQFLLDRAEAPMVLCLDDDLILETDVIARMVAAILDEQCGFVGCAPIGLSYLDDVRPDEQAIELWEGRVAPEVIRPGSAEWQRHRLHNAANVVHVQNGDTRGNENRKYRVAWVGGCVLYDTQRLREAGGFSFWTELPANHCGEDVLAQLRVMARYGGCGLLPSGVYHQELPTTLHDRSVDAPKYLGAGWRRC